MSAASPISGGTAGWLDIERAAASFSIETLTDIVAGKHPAAVAKFQPLFEKGVFANQHLDDYSSYEDLYVKKIERVTEAFRIVRDNPKFMFAHMKQKVKMEDYFDHSGVFLHFTMMLNFIKSHGDKEQRERWLDAARNGDFVAAYAQTELGHGSNVRGLETIIEYHPETREFEVHSPTLTSLKWWPTGMYACTHALVFGKLIVGGVNRGVHGVMVQLRKPDGSTMEGIELGEIGPKLNDSSNNIGYSRFTHVRVPLDRLFSKYSTVTPEGEFEAAPKKLSKMGSISMMLARTSIIGVAYDVLAKATTIAARYSAVRVQGFKDSTIKDGGSRGESTILDYKMQQYRVLKALSLAYCLLWNKRYIQDYIKSIIGEVAAGNDAAADGLPELHATLSGMKAVSTVLAHESIEDCRKACGGQGFLKSSGIARLSPAFAEWVTVEGEQVILSLQTARFLIKACADAAAGKALGDTAKYIAEPEPALTVDMLGTSAGLVEALKVRARRAAHRLSGRFQAAIDGGHSFDEALNGVAVLAYSAAECHVAYIMLRNNALATEKYFEGKPKIRAVLVAMLELQGLMQVTEKSGQWLGAVTVEHLDYAESRIAALMARLRPEIVALVDSFGYLDTQLKSTIGRKDGNVYEAIYDEARQNPLNLTKNGVMMGWDTYKDVLDLEFLASTAVGQHVEKGSKL